MGAMGVYTPAVRGHAMMVVVRPKVLAVDTAVVVRQCIVYMCRQARKRMPSSTPPRVKQAARGPQRNMHA